MERPIIRFGIEASGLLAVGAMVACLAGSQPSSASGVARHLDAVGTRTRVVWVVDQSESTDLTDPAFERFAALDRAYANLLLDPQTSIAAVSYSDTIRSSGFTRNAATLRAVLDPARVGVANDLRAALARAHSIIDADARSLSDVDRSRTRYSVWLVADSAPSQASDDTLLSWVHSLRQLETAYGLEEVRFDVRLGGHPLPTHYEEALGLELTRGRTLFAQLATAGGGTFAEVAPTNVAWWPIDRQR